MALNEYAAPVMRYSGGILNWTVMELQAIDRKVYKQHCAVHPRADVDRLYLPRSLGGRGLLRVEDIIRKESCTLYDYVRTSDEVLLCAVATSGILFSEESAEQFSSRKVAERLDLYESKPLHGYFFFCV